MPVSIYFPFTLPDCMGCLLATMKAKPQKQQYRRVNKQKRAVEKITKKKLPLRLMELSM